MLMKGAAATFAFLLATTFVTTARADDESAKCNPAYEEADALIKAGGDKLLDARAKLLVCARPACKPWMVKECTTSLAEVSARIPSVVFSAKDSRGNEIVEVTVTTGERSLTSRLDGKAIELGPGERTFTFVRADGSRAVVTAVVKEGEKAQRVTATFEGSESGTSAATPATPAHGGEDGESGSSVRTVGWVVAGAGVVGLGVGTFFGIKAIGSTGDANCDEKNTCEKGPLADARSAATVSTIGFIAGGVLLAGGVSLILLAPSRSKSGRSLEAAPSVATSEAGLLFRGRW
jgi:hypothetical protein